MAPTKTWMAIDVLFILKIIIMLIGVDRLPNGSLSEIPVPGSLLLVGAGLVGLVVFSRHKIKKTNHL